MTSKLQIIDDRTGEEIISGVYYAITIEDTRELQPGYGRIIYAHAKNLADVIGMVATMNFRRFDIKKESIPERVNVYAQTQDE